MSEPHGPAATVGYVAARPPLIWWGPKLLADSSAEAIDGRTLRYLLKENLAWKREEEEEEERRRTQQENVAVAAAWPARWCCLFVPLGEEEEEEEEQEKAPEGSSSPLWASL